MVDEAALTLTRATIRVTDTLGISQKTLAAILGLSEATISRMYKGSFVLEPNAKAFEFARLLVQLHEHLGRIVAHDQEAAKAWLIVDNLALGERPIALIQRAGGLAAVVEYLRFRSF